MALPAEFHELARRVSNWGRWGSDDERGTLNLIDGEAVRRGVACARAGRRFSLAIPLDEHGPQTGAIPGRANPEHRMIAVNTAYTGDPAEFCANDDVVTMGRYAPPAKTYPHRRHSQTPVDARRTAIAAHRGQVWRCLRPSSISWTRRRIRTP